MAGRNGFRHACWLKLALLIPIGLMNPLNNSRLSTSAAFRVGEDTSLHDWLACPMMHTTENQVCRDFFFPVPLDMISNCFMHHS